MLNPTTSVDLAGRQRGRSSRRDDGYVIAMTALLILPLMAFCGLAVDLGAWYTRAAQLQRVADAAALAGVTAMPQGPNAARDAALAVAEQNGFVDQDETDGDPEIDIEYGPDGADRYRVTITDGAVPQYFTTLFRDGVTITRASVAEYAPPVRMGSPRNFLGTANLSSSVSGVPSLAAEGFWLSASSPCSPGEDGDKVMPQQAGEMFTGNGTNGSFLGCSSGDGNPTRDPAGYIYGVRVEPGYAQGAINLEIYDAAMCTTTSDGGNLDLQSGGGPFTTTYTVRGPHPNPLDGTVLAVHNVVGRTGTSNECARRTTLTSGGWRRDWRRLAVINTPQVGQTYTIQVQTSVPQNNGRGPSNNFALRARTGSTFAACSADPAEFPTSPLRQAATGIAPNQCPNLFAMQDLSIYAASSGTASFFLASIGPEHGGKTLVLDLFDPGEKAEWMEVLDPNGVRVNFDWEVVERYDSEPAPSGGGSGSTNQIRVDGSGPQPGPGRYYGWRYNDRQLRIRIELPREYTLAYGSRTWWRIQYRFGADPVDRTTWSVSVIGDPVRLVE